MHAPSALPLPGPTPPLERAVAVALGTTGALLAFVAWDQSFWWRSIDDYRFGWLAPAFAVYAVSRRWREVRAAASACRPGHPAGAPSGLARLIHPLVLASFALGTLLFLFGSLARANAGPSHPGSLAIALGAGVMTLALVYLSASGGNVELDFAAPPRVRWRLVAPFVYPATVWLITAPLLTAFETRISPFLLHEIKLTVLGVFHVFRLPIELQGNVFVLPGGPVGIEEACIGLRSMTGCIFGAFFLAEGCLATRAAQAALLGAAVALALAANLARVVFLNLWAYRYGPAAIEGVVHDSAGWSVLVLTALGLFGVVALLERREARRAGASA